MSPKETSDLKLDSFCHGNSRERNHVQETARSHSRERFKMAASLYVLFEELLSDDFIEREFTFEAVDEPFLTLLFKKKGRRQRFRNQQYYENIVPRYNVEDFRSHFRVTRHSVTVI